MLSNVQKTILKLKSRVIALAVASKNDEDLVTENHTNSGEEYIQLTLDRILQYLICEVLIKS